MAVHIRLQLHSGFDAVARLCARLHAIRSPVTELHVRDGLLCLHLEGPAAARRTRTVLERLVDVTVVSDESGKCVTSPTAPWSTTHYVVSSQPIATSVPAAH